MKQIKQIFVEYESPTFITFFNFVLTLFKRSVKIYESRLKTMLLKRFDFIKKNTIYKKNSFSSFIKKNMELSEN